MGQSPPGGTQHCRYLEILDGLDAEVRRLLQLAVEEIEGLIFTDRGQGSSSLQWQADRFGAYTIGMGLRHEPLRSEESLKGFLWLHYVSDGPGNLDEYPIEIDIPAELARDAAYRVDLMLAAAKAHRRLMQARGLIAD